MAEAIKVDKQYVNKKVSGPTNHETFSLLVNVFAWLIQEDKKQNPELYKINKLT